MLNKKIYIFLIVIISTIVAIALGAFSNIAIKDWLAENLLTQYQHQERLIANQIAQNLENNVEGVEEKLNLAASMPEIKSSNATTCNEKLAEVFSTLDSKIGNLGRVNEKGFFYCSINKSLLGLKAEKLGAYIPQIFNDPQHKPVLSRTILPPGANSRVAALHVPVYDENKVFRGTLGGAIYFNEIQEKYLKNIVFARNGHAVLLDDNGDILYHPKTAIVGKNIDNPETRKLFSNSKEFDEAIAAAKEGKSGTVRYSFEGTEKIAAYRPANIMPGHHWAVFVTVPVAEASKELAVVGVDKASVGFTAVLSFAVLIIACTMLVNLYKSYELQKTKDEFVSLASHQLRTPATAVMNYIDLVLDGVSGKITKQQREFLLTARDSNQRQIGIINDILNIARLDAGRIKLSKQPTDVSKLVKEIVDEQMATIKERQQSIEIIGNDVPQVALDKTYGRMIIENLISNASKYTPENGKIAVELSADEQAIYIAICDNGVGIAKKDIAKLFGKLNRIKNKLSEEVGGTGLGLYLVKEIVQMHGGTISVESEIDKGSTFTIRLPK